MTKEAIANYEAALKEAFPRGATGDVFYHWNEARKALAEKPTQDDPCPGCRKGVVCRTPKCGRLKLPVDHPYRSKQPAQRKPLTDEEISNIWCKVSNTDFVTADTHEFARAIEAAHGIKGNP